MKKDALKSVLSIGVSVLSLLLSLSAHAQENATQAFEEGVTLFKDGYHEGAVKKFRQANELKPSWKIQYNIGQCEAALKRYGLAIEAFEQYLGEGGDDVPARRRDEVLAELERFRKMVGYVRVRGEAGIVVYVDEIERGRTPMSSAILVTAGVKHWFWLVKDDAKILTTNERVSGGETIELTASGYVDETPAPVPAPAATAPSPEPKAPEPVATEPTAPEPSEPAPVAPAEPASGEEDSEGLSPVLFWVGAGATVAFGGVTLAMALVTENKWKDAENDPWDNSLRDSGSTTQIVGYIGMGLTGAALILTVVAIPFTNWGGEESGGETALSLNPWGNSESGGLLLEGRF